MNPIYSCSTNYIVREKRDDIIRENVVYKYNIVNRGYLIKDFYKSYDPSIDLEKVNSKKLTEYKGDNPYPNNPENNIDRSSNVDNYANVDVMFEAVDDINIAMENQNGIDGNANKCQVIINKLVEELACDDSNILTDHLTSILTEFFSRMKGELQQYDLTEDKIYDALYNYILKHREYLNELDQITTDQILESMFN